VLTDELATVLAATPGLTTAELVECLAGGVASPTERQITLALYAHHGRFRCDRGSIPRWWLAGASAVPQAHARSDAATVEPADGLALYAWQAEALRAWTRRGGRGVIEAVTGTGKTMLGIVATLDELRRRGQVLVLVPTLELQQQWVAEMARHLGAGPRVGRLGNGSADTLVSHDVVVAVVNSARSIDVRPTRAGGLLVADECHRYATDVNRLALDGRFVHRLGLSATYARDDDGTETWLDPYFGGSCFRMGYRRAIDDAVTARFTVALIGVRFAAEEQEAYDVLSKLMSQLRARLVERHGVDPDPFDTFLRAVNRLADGIDGDPEASGVARRYRAAMLDRRRLLGATPAKQDALIRLAPAMDQADRSLVFTHSIMASERAASTLSAAGLISAAVHSELPRRRRQEVLARFASGEVGVLCAPRVLDEGVDVPAADLAVIVSASRSRRQMVQRMGRVLRRKPDGRRARFAVIFVEGTVEDPARGAHEVFLDEILGVADDARRFSADDAVTRPASVCSSLAPSAGPTTSPLLAPAGPSALL